MSSKKVHYEDDIFIGAIYNKTSESPLPGEYIKLKKKLPMYIYDQICTVFNYCQFNLDSEGMVLIMYKDGYEIGVPQQWVGKSHVDAHPELDAGTLFHGVIGDAHSHPRMGAFHSSIDLADERKHRHGLYMVFSSTDQGFSTFTSTISAVAYARGRKFILNPNEVFDKRTPHGDGVIPDKDWKERIRTSSCPICPKVEPIYLTEYGIEEDHETYKRFFKLFSKRKKKHEDDLWRHHE